MLPHPLPGCLWLPPGLTLCKSPGSLQGLPTHGICADSAPDQCSGQGSFGREVRRGGIQLWGQQQCNSWEGACSVTSQVPDCDHRSASAPLFHISGSRLSDGPWPYPSALGIRGYENLRTGPLRSQSPEPKDQTSLKFWQSQSQAGTQCPSVRPNSLIPAILYFGGSTFAIGAHQVSNYFGER